MHFKLADELGGWRTYMGALGHREGPQKNHLARRARAPSNLDPAAGMLRHVRRSKTGMEKTNF